MGLFVCPNGASARCGALRLGIWVLVLLQLQSVARASDQIEGQLDPSFCTRAIMVTPSNEAFQNYELAIHPKVYADSAAVMGEIVRDCPSPAACSKEELAVVAERAVVAKGGDSRSLLSRMLLLPRRGLVFLLWGGASLGPGVLSFYVTSKLPLELRIPLSGFVMQMSKDLFERINGPIKDKLGPMVHQLAFWLWGPSEEDGWAQILKNLNEASRLENSQIYNQVILIRDDFKRGARALIDGDEELAATHYMDAFLDSTDLFAGLHLDRLTTVRAVRSALRKNRKAIPTEVLVRVRDRVGQMIAELGDDELQNPSKRNQLIKSAHKVISVWFGVPA
jgi:hypothetical protein